MAKTNDDTEERKQFILDYVKEKPLLTSGHELYEALNKKYPYVSPGGHRGMVGRVLNRNLPWNRTKECPNVEKGECTTVAKSMEEALELFGHRYKGRVLQSYCKECRNRKRREARAAKRAEKEAAKKAEAEADGKQVDIEEAIAESQAPKGPEAA